MGPILVYQATLIGCVAIGAVAFVASLSVFRRFLELRHERWVRGQTSNPGLPDRLVERLDRIEATVESTALEVERIAEANRFMAKLLADRAAPAAPLSKPERVITPH